MGFDQWFEAEGYAEEHRAVLRKTWEAAQAAEHEPGAADAQVMEAAVRVTGDALNDLLAACHGPDGNLAAPDKKAVMRARSMLPARYSYALGKKA